MLQFIDAGPQTSPRRIAVRHRSGAGPQVVWLGGFHSDMGATKAEALDRWASEHGRAFLRFDYSGHGQSGGRFADGAISDWLEDTLAVLDRFAPERPILVGSSMGGWIALLATRHLRSLTPHRAPAGLVLIAPATDFTERLMWAGASEAIRREIMETGVHHRASQYAEEPTPITRRLIEDGRQHLLLDRETIEVGCPVHILQGMQDPDVPWRHALELVEHLPGDCVQLTLIRMATTGSRGRRTWIG